MNEVMTDKTAINFYSTTPHDFVAGNVKFS
jgi:hypothetical protein